MKSSLLELVNDLLIVSIQTCGVADPPITAPSAVNLPRRAHEQNIKLYHYHNAIFSIHILRGCVALLQPYLLLCAR